MKLRYSKYQQLIQQVSSVPLCVLGVGVYRAWTETVYINAQYVTPAQKIGSYELFNIFIIITLLILIFLAKRIAPLCKIPGIFTLAGLLMTASALMNFLSIQYPSAGDFLALPAVMCGAVGISFVMMLWSEYYGCINAVRTGIYYTASIAFGAVILWVFKGLDFWWVCAGAVLLPFISLCFLKKSLSLLPESERPHKGWGSFQFPWKPVLLVTLYSFAYGLMESVFRSQVLGPHSSFGVVLPAIIIFLGITLRLKSFNFLSFWKVALVLMLLSLFPFDFFFPFEGRISAFFAVSGYSSCLILIMVVLSNLSYRFGVCALWLFAIERVARLGAVMIGDKMSSLIYQHSNSIVVDVGISVLIGSLVVIATLLVLSEKGLSSSWGVILKESPANERLVSERNRLGIKCSEIAKQFDLSTREEEVLLFLAQKKKRSAVGHELFIATSTYKTHVRNIYQKLEVHSRKELYGVLGIE